MTTTIYSILEEFRKAASDNRDLGDRFERLIATYLLTDPQYADRLSDVWLWNEWPNRGNRTDVGIDLVARERGTGDHWAIQCKFFDPARQLEKSHIDSFFTASGQKYAGLDGEISFKQRLIFSTTDKWSKHAEDALEDQTIPTFRIGVQNLADSPVDWSQFSLANVRDIRLRKKKELREHQLEALEAVRNGLAAWDRGKLIMACGTGKTLTALKIAESETPKSGRILFLAPSISLVSQTLREWTAEASEEIHAFVVCSDSKVGKESEDIRAHDLAYPATTDARRLSAAVAAVAPDRRTVVFSTYQSIQVVSDAQRFGLDEFDLIICDEAHRTTGITLDNEEDESAFVKVHDQSVVGGKKRLYMTATPRIFADASKTRAAESSATLYSMDDENVFGPEFYRLGFGKAVDKGLLTEYKVLIVAVEEDRMASLANQYNAFKIDTKKAIDTRFATKIVGSWKGLSKQGLVLVDEDGEQERVTDDAAPMRRAVAFSRSIKDSKATTDVFRDLVELYAQAHDGDQTAAMVRCDLDHVDGGMNSLQRLRALNWLKAQPADNECRVLSNARCLSEGIDVPALDAVIFFDTRESIVDIVQSVGRVMRKADGKQYGYIVLPVGIPSSKVKDYNSYIDGDPQFKGIWKVIKALRAHDESLVDEAEFRRKIRVVDGGERERGGDRDDRGGDTLPLDFPALPIDAISDAVYAAIPKKLGDREYWSEWAKGVAQIAERLIARIRDLLLRPEARAAFDSFLKGLRDNLNPAVDEAEAVEMLAQHILTRPVFEALFEGYSFTDQNVVSKAMQAVVDVLDDHDVTSEAEQLEKFYASVRDRVSLAKSDKSRQDIIRNLYDTFFYNAFRPMAERLGIVYTPVEVVDFILNSVDVALRKHFDTCVSDKGVHILDPFTGTGTFMVRLLQSGLIRPDDLLRKYQHELHANEIVLLAYYIAAINVESAQHALTDKYYPFDGIVLTDTFQMTETRDLVDTVVLPENSSRVNRQKQQDIQVIVGNPPYSAQQESENDNNKNLSYDMLDESIRNTYAARSSGKLAKNLYDSYIRAIRWASNRIRDKGIIAFVTNGSFLDANNMDGLRKCLTDEFSHLYVFNLRGDQRTSGEASRAEGGKIFGSGSRTPVAITIMVKDPTHVGDCELNYRNIGDYLSQEEKLSVIDAAGSISELPWERLTPNKDGDWINQRDPAFDCFIPLGNKDGVTDEAIFSFYSLGVVTNRDPWTYSFSKGAVASNMTRLIAAYNENVTHFARACRGKSKDQWPDIESVIDTDPKRISWTRSLKADAKRGKPMEFVSEAIVRGSYRPFTKQWMYFDRSFNEMVYQIPKLFPTPNHENLVISSTGVADRKGYSALIADHVPNMHLTDTGQCFPLYWYEKVESAADVASLGLFDAPHVQPDADGYVRHDAISDWALMKFQQHYGDAVITKRDIFLYVYGVLHSPEYKRRFASDLKKMLPRIPFARDFYAFRDAGENLAHWHLNYEAVEPFPLTEEPKRLVMEPGDYRVEKMAFGKKSGKPDKSVIVYNGNLILRDIPPEAYEYVVNAKSAIEWIMERYAVSKDKASGIGNDPNGWSDDARYIVDLLKRIVRVSLETVRIVKGLPSLEEHVVAAQSEESDVCGTVA
ncbi:DEAD/DEAH box helicase [Burkholderia ubonensis]|uniref:Damage-inducible protein n=1 Tax=Burkholderia ubonensis TaxID=101571 RepID=A0A107E9K8_9BURK|nr:type ISP restriction/modification enzyme [Burkholderia ubonensis]KWD71070.1 damage-inducible protein [Burkholderia ubonensis]KWD77974.1 damage-inducible protein [Burkholderia ubonensis]KWD98998.1 damage-inducible protein [Burkholderia ubonensis]KWE08115.1 damage-inducible protein [Burkholderia ubonensis]